METISQTRRPERPSVIKPTDPLDLDGTETTIDASQSSFLDVSEQDFSPLTVEVLADTCTDTDDDNNNNNIPTTVYPVIPKLDYASIPSFDQFTDLTNDDHYIRLPRDWHVLVADIEGSTQLIEQGRYRDVNTVGVSCIAAVRNALKELPRDDADQHHQTDSTKFNEDFPYVFGGDGASMVVAPHQLEAASNALRSCQSLATSNYDMHLRIGCIEVAALEDLGRVIVEVARYEIADGMCIALFRGGGLALADTWIKAGQGHIEPLPDLSEEEDDDYHDYEEEESEEGHDEEDYHSEEEDEEPAHKRRQPAEANLDGLSCRWKKIPSKNGCVLSLLCMHNEDVYSNDFLSRREMEALSTSNDEVDEDNETNAPGHDDDDEKPEKKPSSSVIYGKVLRKLAEILAPQNSLAKANPVNTELATYKTATEMIEDENRMHTARKSSFSFWTGRAVEIGLCHVIFKMKQLQTAIIDAPAYTAAMRTHADHCKFDDMIRMVLDCTPAQADEIEDYFKTLHRNGRQVFYGLQRSQYTIMTCLLEDTEAGNHIHFVDGDLGGYAVAAKDLKLQLGNYALAKRGMNVRLNLEKQHSQKQRNGAKTNKSKKKLRKTITK